MPTFFIETFGCQMNKSDSELIEISLESEGFIPSPSWEGADIVVFNTCSVRQHAEDRATARIREARAHLPKGGVLVLAGCMAQRTGDDFIKRKWADIVVGPYQSPEIGRMVKEIIGRKKSAVALSQNLDSFVPRLDPALASRVEQSPRHRWVTITHGCENFCTYCIVPYVRGKLISFPSASILSYIDRLIEKEIHEVTLLGQNVNQYGQDNGDIPFYSLLEKVAQKKGIARVNFLTSHPKDFCEDTVRVIRDNGNISRGIHLPLQSGSDAVLARMNRKYTWSHYLTIIETIERELS
ncbi:MAG: MiaB/RimO family radical SAM methylthiotransferase, partial [Spirochaetota bacterium]